MYRTFGHILGASSDWDDPTPPYLFFWSKPLFSPRQAPLNSIIGLFLGQLNVLGPPSQASQPFSQTQDNEEFVLTIIFVLVQNDTKN